ncbi:hypothetical protein IFM89_021251 [Coptis chinensis]|uniref:Uncharacterized protein n=1 Tax=Coptis chinensis TaxID=261450 RepID=A0A835MD65_9MAGN|nr:hypothetical protein IFM89_021251 [Coptis chinensis]
MESIAIDMFVGRKRFVTLLLMRLIETVILYLSNDQSFWEDIKDGQWPLGPLGLQQFYLDMKFVYHFSSQRRYSSRHLHQVINDIISRAMAIFSSTGMDQATLLCESIARKVFPRETYLGYEGVEDAHYTFTGVCDALRKRNSCSTSSNLWNYREIYMSSKKWDSLPYNRVASIAMSNYKKHFLKHDENRFNEFLGKWKRMVDDLSKKVITFSENPKLHKIEGGNLRSKTQFIRRMEAGYNTDFQKVFDLLLQVAVAGNLDKDKMIEKVFVFSDMEFDNARRPYGGRGG